MSYPRHTHFSEHHSDSSNPTASTGVDRCQTGTFKTPVFWRLARREKRLDFRCARTELLGVFPMFLGSSRCICRRIQYCRKSLEGRYVLASVYSVCSVVPWFSWFPGFRGSLIFRYKSEYPLAVFAGSVMVVSIGTCLECVLGSDKRSYGGSANRTDCKPW